MKKLFLLIAILAVVPVIFGQTLFTYGNKSVKTAEFLRAFNKNKTDTPDKEKSLRQYLDLYIRFKLKVQAAVDLHLDTVQQLKTELQNFRSQIADSYLNDDEGINELLDEVLIRNQKEIHVIHFYLPLPIGSSSDDKAKATNVLDEIRVAQKNKTISDAELMKDISKKNKAVIVTDLGFITALSMPYEMENLVYALTPGTISTIFTTRTGVHLFKNIGERKSSGKWTIAQILFNFPPGADEVKINEIKKTADSVFALLKSGADFAVMAKQFSEDRTTAPNGGVMPTFGTGKFEDAFEEKVFDLKKDGQLSAPIRTSFGYHIVKRIQQQPVPTDRTNDSAVQIIKQQIVRDSRMATAQVNFIKTITIKTALKKSAVKQDVLFAYADSAIFNKLQASNPFNKKVIFSYKKENILGLDWLNFIKQQQLTADQQPKKNYANLLDKFIANNTLAYYKKYLEEFNEAFNYQMEEFKAGSLLFDVMEKNVWSRAAEDSNGLKQFYAINRGKYQWTNSALVLLFNCSDSKAADAAKSSLQNGVDWKLIRDQSEGNVQVDSGRYEIAQLPIPASVQIKAGMIFSPFVNSGDKSAVFVQVLQLFPANQQRSLMEARGPVINDFQAFLDDQWVAELKKKYPVKINEAAFKEIIK